MGSFGYTSLIEQADRNSYVQLIVGSRGSTKLFRVKGCINVERAKLYACSERQKAVAVAKAGVDKAHKAGFNTGVKVQPRASFECAELLIDEVSEEKHEILNIKLYFK